MPLLTNLSILKHLSRFTHSVNILYRHVRYFSSEQSPWSAVEAKWVPVIRAWDKSIAERFENSPAAQRSYVLSMFPYPSGNLHLGHLRVYTVADTIYRYQCMTGLAVLQPMGWDAFGLPAENAAIDRNTLPKLWTIKNIEKMRHQMNSTMLLGIDWSREVSTVDPSYYRWTQWLFLQLYKKGLAYYRLAFVNWDPVDQTVLADELVDANGRSWRSGAKVVRKPLRQWYFRITAFSESLLDGLTEIEGNQWRDVINLQRGWLGKLDGTQMELDVLPQQPNDSVLPSGERISVFTSLPGLAAADFISHIEVGPDSVYFEDRFRKPETLRGANSTRKLILHRQPILHTDGKLTYKLAVVSAVSASYWPELLAIYAVHPFTHRPVLMVRMPDLPAHTTGATAFPNSICFRLKGADRFQTGSLLNLTSPPGRLQPVAQAESVVDPVSVSPDELESFSLRTPVAALDGLSISAANTAAIKLLKDTGRGGYLCNSSRTDWLVSRQRYWGTPIPIVHCDSCGTVPVSEDDLPVLLPDLDRPLARGDSPLKENLAWQITNCPKCGQPAKRETDTLDTFVDSSWYYLRYLDPANDHAICDKAKARAALPVNVYVGGIEHATRHLYYARFMAHFLHGLGIIPCREPFARFLPIGLVLGQTFQDPRTGGYVSADQVEAKRDSQDRPIWVDRETGVQLNSCWDKMSKSKLNGVDPTDVVSHYGVEVVRLMMLTNVGPHRARKWQQDGVLRGVLNWRSKLCTLVDRFTDHANSLPGFTLLIGNSDPLDHDSDELRSVHDATVQRVNFYYMESFVLSAAIARLQELTEALRKRSSTANYSSFTYLRALADLIVMLTPLAPVLSCELWSRLQAAIRQDAIVSLLPPANVHVNPTNATFDCWPYDLNKSVLNQPFPVPKDLWSEERENHGCKNSAAT